MLNSMLVYSIYCTFTFFTTSFSFKGLIVALILISHNDMSLLLKIQKQPPEVFCEKGVLKTFPNLQENPCEVCYLIKKRTLTQVFSCVFCKISKNSFFTEHLRVTTSEVQQCNCFL